MKDIDVQKVINLRNQKLSVVKIAEIVSSYSTKVSKILRENGFIVKDRKGSGRKRIYKCNDYFLKQIDSEEKAYFLGFMMADGCITGKNTISIILDKKDESHLLKIRNLLSSSNPIKHFKSRFSEKHRFTDKVKLSIESDILFLSLEENGCTKRKTNTLKFPKLRSDLENHFIRGYFDGDGSVYKTGKNTLGFSFLGTLEFISEIHKRMSFSKAKIQKEKRSAKNVYYVNYGGHNCAKLFYDYLYNNATIFLERKKIIFDKYFNERLSETTIGTS
jgi:intein/homing endonuclease